MNKKNMIGGNGLIAAGLAVIILVPLGWAVLLMTRGISQWDQSSETTTAQSALGSFSEVQQVPVGLFSYGGSTAWAPIRQRVDSVILSERPEFQLRYLQPTSGPVGSGQGIRMLLNDQLSFVQTSRPLLQSEYDLAKQRGHQLEQIPVAIDAIAFVVHPDLDMPGLTLEQIRQIYSGQLVNWQQLGGPDLDIVPLSRPASSGGTVSFFTQAVMRDQDFGAKVEFISTSTMALRQLVEIPGGIFFDSASIIVPQCNGKPLPISRESDEFVAPYRASYVPPTQCPQQRNTLNIEAFQAGRYPITRYLYVVIKQNGRVDAQAGQAYANFLMTAQGQALIAHAGFVRIHR